MKVWSTAVCLSFGFIAFGFSGTSFGHPLDSPGTVYIDGSPCNLPCQSYMAWSRQALKANQGAAKGTANVSAGAASRQVARKRVSKRAVPALVETPLQNNLQAALAEISAPLPVPRPKTEDVPLEDVPLQNNLQAALTETSEPLPVPRPKTEDVPVEDVPMKDVPLKVESSRSPQGEESSGAGRGRAGSRRADLECTSAEGHRR